MNLNNIFSKKNQFLLIIPLLALIGCTNKPPEFIPANTQMVRLSDIGDKETFTMALKLNNAKNCFVLANHSSSVVKEGKVQENNRHGAAREIGNLTTKIISQGEDPVAVVSDDLVNCEDIWNKSPKRKILPSDLKRPFYNIKLVNPSKYFIKPRDQFMNSEVILTTVSFEGKEKKSIYGVCTKPNYRNRKSY